MSEFERRLSECLEALQEGRWDIDECARRYPEHADELRAQLTVATSLSRAYAGKPDERWASSARERFLVATGQRLTEAMDNEPEPSFFAAARVRFLMAAQRLRQERAAQPAARRVPVFGSPMRALGALAASMVIFFGFSTYTVATASAALPGDWQYPVKLQTERVRLALAFSDDQKREIKLDIAEERIREIEALASKGRIIGPGVLDRFADQTATLVAEAQEGKLDSTDAARLQQVSVRSSQVLNAVQGKVDPAAEEKLAEAKSVADSAVDVTRDLVVADPDRPLIVITPQNAVPTATPAPTEEATEEPTAAPETPTAEPTQPGATPTEAPAVDPGDVLTDEVVLGETPIVELGEIKLYTLAAGRLRMYVPGAGTEWFIDNAPSSGVPLLLTFKTQDQQSFVVVNTRTGDMYWYISPAGNNRFDEVQMRITRDGQVFEADPAVLRLFYGDDAEIPILMLQSIKLVPEAKPTPEPTATGSAGP
jgi:hypothetical protein